VDKDKKTLQKDYVNRCPTPSTLSDVTVEIMVLCPSPRRVALTFDFEIGYEDWTILPYPSLTTWQVGYHRHCLQILP
jgi:hypothetical protein